jgi:LacI family transcriptional regulator
LAAQLGYRTAPTRAVRRPRSAKPITIGVLIGAPLVSADRGTFPAILGGIRHRASIEHAAVDVVSLDPAEYSAEAAQKHVFRLIRSAHWRGAILIYPFAAEFVQALAEKISVVSVLTEYADPGIDVIDTDHEGVGLLVRKLIDLGHRRIGFASWHYPVGGLWAVRRFGAFAGAMLDVRHVFNVGPNASRSLDTAALADAVARATRQDGVTAWACAADHQAYQLIADLRARGLRIPEDVSITGFDGNEPPVGLPALATAAVPNEHIGEGAVAQLISRLLYPRSPRRKILVATALVEGATVAPAPLTRAIA